MTTRDPQRPTTLHEMTLTPEEEAEALSAKAEAAGPFKSKPTAPAEVDASDVPEWAREWLPPTLRIPRGRQVAFIRFQSAWTEAPDAGVPSLWPEVQPGVLDEDGKSTVVMVEHLSRVLMLWTISDVEEHQALKSARGERERVGHEQAKRMLRAVDGKILDWTGNWAKGGNGLASPDNLWRELGSKCRQPLLNIYLRLHNLEAKEMANFFVNGLFIASAVAG